MKKLAVHCCRNIHFFESWKAAIKGSPWRKPWVKDKTIQAAERRKKELA
jgi:hypothetical protein